MHGKLLSVFTSLCAATVATSTVARAGTARDVYDDSWFANVRTVAAPHVMKPFGKYPPRFDSGVLQYYNGPVEVTPKVYLIFWNFKHGGDPSFTAKYLNGFMTGLGGSSWIDIDTQYYQIAKGSKEYIQNPSAQLGGVWNYESKTIPSSPTDVEVHAVANRGVTHFGYDPDATYFVMTPTGHNTAGFGTTFCAYHGAFQNGAGQFVAYANLPYMPDAKNCGANFVNRGKAGLLDGVSIVAGHEMAEAQTDPFPPFGWFDKSSGEEIGDLCAWKGLADITLPTGRFAVQPLYSDATGSCVLGY